MSGQSSPAAKSASSSGLPPPLDPFRVLPSGLRKPILSFSETYPAHATSSTQDIISITPIAYSARLAGRQLLLERQPQDVGQVKLSKKAKGKRKEVDRERSVKDVKKRKKEKRKRELMKECKEKGKEGNKLKAGDYINYDLLLPLHYLHLSYLSELFPLPPSPISASLQPHTHTHTHTYKQGSTGVAKLENGMGFENIQSKLIKAEFTGAMIEIKAAKNPHLVGLIGIIVMETAETFYIVSKDNILKLIPKKHSLFTFSFPAYSFPTLSPPPNPITSSTDPALYNPPPSITFILDNTPRIEVDVLGGAIRFRAADRAGRRFKVANGGGGWIGDWMGDSVSGGLFRV